MYLYFDKDGTLREQIIEPLRVGDSGNDIFVYWDDERINLLNQNNVYCRYKKPNGEYSLNITAVSSVTKTIPYDQDRDLKFFKYNQSYKFFRFIIPDEVFSPIEDMQVYSVLFSCWFVQTVTIKTMSLVAFAVEPSTQSIKSDENINIAQWNELIKLLTHSEFNLLTVTSIEFNASTNAPSLTGLSMYGGNIYWKGSLIATGNDFVRLIGNQTIEGIKTFRNEIISQDKINFNQYEEDEPFIKVQSGDATYDLKATQGDDDYEIYLPNETGRLLTDKALTPTLLTPSVCRNFGHVDGDTTSVLITDGIGTYTVPVLDYYQIYATVSSGSIANINQTTGEITIYSGDATVTLEYYYEGVDPTDDRIGFKFNIGENYNGIYLFTFSNLLMLVPIYSLVENTMYKFTGVGLQDELGSAMNLIYNMKRVGSTLEIWSGNTDFPMIENRVGYLFKIKLYTQA